VRRAADTGWEGWLYASVAYAALVAWTILSPLPAREPPRPATRVRLVAPAPAEAVPPPAPAPPPRREPPRRMEASRRAAPEPLAPPPLVASAPPPSAPAPRRFTVSMEATVPGGGVAVRRSRARPKARLRRWNRTGARASSPSPAPPTCVRSTPTPPGARGSRAT
jgi:hypothetical protein